MTRNTAIDGLRGLLLIIIAINHLESKALTPFTVEPFGFVSAAEAFIFLSGFVAAIVYGRLVHNPIQLKRKIWQRALHLYLVTIAGVLAIYSALHLGILPEVWYQPWGDYFLLENYLKYPIESLLLSFIQIHQMGYLDILVLYMAPMIFLPWALLLLHRGKGWLVILLSALVWLAAQFINDVYLINVFESLSIQSKVDAGFMDIMAWQLLFYLGVIAGYYQKFKSIDFVANRHVTVGVCIIAVSFLVMDKFSIVLPFSAFFEMQLYGWKDVGLIRLLNTLALAYIAALIIRKSPQVFNIRPFVFLGRHSLQVFTFHAVAIYFFLPWMPQFNESDSALVDVVLVLVFIMTLYIPAWLHQLWRQRKTVEQEFERYLNIHK